MSAAQKKSLAIFTATFVAFAVFVLGATLAAGIEKNKISNNAQNIERVEGYVRDEFKGVHKKLDDIMDLLR